MLLHQIPAGALNTRDASAVFRKISSIMGLSFIFILFAASPFLSVSAFFSPSGAAPMTPVIQPSITGSSVSSFNWAGYAIKEAKDTVTSVRGSWTQQAITCPSATTLEAAAFWVGIDGFSSKTVEQTGTLALCYRKWYNS